MMGIGDVTTLAVTKLRTRRTRTIVTVVLSGLLFAGLVATFVVVQGADNSIRSFNEEGLNNRFIVQALTDPPLTGSMLNSKDIQQQAQSIYTQTVTAKKAEAKKLGISYEPSSETFPTSNLHELPGQQPKTVLNLNSPAAQQALQEYLQAHPSPGLGRLRQVAAPYNPNGFYAITAGNLQGTLVTMQKGIENFDINNQSGSDQHNDLFQSSMIEEAAPQLAAPFLLPVQPRQYDKEAIPIILPYSKVGQLVGLTPLAKSATPEQQLNRIKELYAKAGNIVFSACYRNSVSESQISTAISQAAEIAQNKGSKDYQKPDVIYGLPAADSCGQATILNDNRTLSEKALDAKQDEFDKMFGQVIDPIQIKLTFRVVGLTPDLSSGSSSTTFGGILQNIVGSSLNDAIVIPINMLNKLPNASLVKSILFPRQNNSFGFSATSYFVEFPKADDARNFINNKSCTTRPDGRCATTSKPFQLNAYGSNSIALQDLRHKFSHFLKLAALGVVMVATIIMSGTIGRMIADSRRETAIFRAIGARRLDIVSIYSIYTLCLSLYVVLFALTTGLLMAYGFDRHFWGETTVQAQLLFGASNTSREFHFFAVNLSTVSLVMVAIVAVGLVGMLLPLARNVRRSPIKDMREE